MPTTRAGDGNPTKLPDDAFLVPNVARMNDFYLSGKDHYKVDREAALAVMRAVPALQTTVRASRYFLRRVIQYLITEAGITQIIDIGPGLPALENVHDIAQAHNPGTKVAYVDNDPLVLLHARALLAKTSETVVAWGDLRDPDTIRTNSTIRDHIDFTQPVAIMLCGILHFVTDEQDPTGIVSALMDAVPAGSHLVISHGELRQGDKGLQAAQRIYENANAPLVLRTEHQISAFFDGLEMVDPGVVRIPWWRPEPPIFTLNEDVLGFGGVGVKR
ncbi:SAM-dependent methyltransferase [Streptosporangium sp. CA-115845]|uniref:SAM-dependent methyltransferase n=1 Tax=Streptosporangium sp. CA-115845 TaxID=3240071 RepID=UPI003D8A68C1